MADKVTKSRSNADEKRRAILMAAITVFIRKGFHAATVREIAREAGVADGTMYLYFKSKTDLLPAMFALLRDSAPPDIEFTKMLDLDIRQFVHAFLWHPLTHLQKDNGALFRTLLQEALVDAELRAIFYREVVEKAFLVAEPPLQRLIDHKEIKAGDAAILLRTLSSLVFGLILQRALGDSVLEQRWNELPDFITDILMNGLVAR